MAPSSSVFFVHGGKWNYDKYEGGIKDLIPIPSSGLTFEELLAKLEVRLKKKRNTHVFDLDAWIQPAVGDGFRMKITDNYEWSCLHDFMVAPTIYVSVCEKNNVFEQSSIVPLNSCIVPALHNSSEESAASQTASYNGLEASKQWVIPGASHQASLPSADLVIQPERVRGELAEGSTFESKELMITAVSLYHLRNCLEFRTPRSDVDRCYIVCTKGKTCKFILRAKSLGLSWKIYEWAPHTCTYDLRVGLQPKVSPKAIAVHVGAQLREDGSILRPRDIQAQMLREFGVNVKYSTALSAKNVALNVAYGDQEVSFQLLPKYLYMLEKMNPGSVVDLQTCDGAFEYCYISLDACARAFRACRPVIVIDATHLKGKYKGVLFVASTKDANEQIVPLAFGIGDKENDSSWCWFLEHVRRSFGTREELLIVSDQHISIKNAVNAVFPGVPHGFCTYHIQGNLKARDEVIEIFQDAANAYRENDFNIHMDNLELTCPGAHTKLLNIGPSRWAKCRCPVRRYNFGTSNTVECLNSRLKWARKLPVCSLLEYTCNLVQTWFYERRSIAGAISLELSDYSMERLGNAIRVGRTMKVEGISESKFKLISGDKSYIVDIAAMTCSCRVWQMDLFPCSHATRAISHVNQTPIGYVHSYYSTATWREIYAAEVNPVPDPSDWRVPCDVATRVVGTPSNPKQAGRPRTRRIQSMRGAPRDGVPCDVAEPIVDPSGDEPIVDTIVAKDRLCGRCKQKGHYQNTCSVYLEINVEDEQVVGGGGGKRSRKGPIKCGICGVPGHSRRTCTDPNIF